MAGKTRESIVVLQSIADATEGGQACLDIIDYKGECDFVLSALTTAGTTPTCDVKIQTGDLTRGAEYTTEGATDVKLREGATTAIKIGAKFTQSGAKSIKSVFLRLKKLGTITTANLTLKIETDSAGVPSGTPATNGTATVVSTDSITSAYTWVEFVFPKPVDLSDATVYHLALTSTYTASSSNCICWNSKSGLTSGGNKSTHNNTSYTADADASMNFYGEQITFADVTPLTFTQVTTTASLQAISKDVDDLNRYVRAHVTITGSSTPAFTVGCHISGYKFS